MSERTGRVVIAPGDRAPRTTGGWTDEPPVERGDVLRISCPPADAEVVQAHGEGRDGFVVLRWSWQPSGEDITGDDDDTGEVDEEADRLLAVPVDPAQRPLMLWRYDPDPANVLPSVGDRVKVSIPPTVAHVSYTTETRLHEDMVAGRPPRDADVHIAVLPHGISECQATTEGDNDQRISFSPYGPEPIRVELLHRPYRFLEDGDEVTDPAGRRWKFFKPLSWVNFDRDEPTPPLAAPDWPLHLICRYDMAPTDDEVAAVATATAAGSHADEVTAWRERSGAALIPPEHEGAHDTLPILDKHARAAEAARTRADLRGRTLAEIVRDREEARDWHHNVAKIVLDDIDAERVERASVRLHEIDRVLAHLRTTGADTYDGNDITG